MDVLSITFVFVSNEYVPLITFRVEWKKERNGLHYIEYKYKHENNKRKETIANQSMAHANGVERLIIWLRCENSQNNLFVTNTKAPNKRQMRKNFISPDARAEKPAIGLCYWLTGSPSCFNSKICRWNCLKSQKLASRWRDRLSIEFNQTKNNFSRVTF